MNFEKDKLYIAFYKGEKKLLDKIIKWTSRGLYSHVEMIYNFRSYSSSGRDGGTRAKWANNMHFDDRKKWDVFEVNVSSNNVVEELLDEFLYRTNTTNEKHDGEIGKYDYYSVILYHILRLAFIPKMKKDRYICTEYVLEFIECINLMDFVKENKIDNLYKLAFSSGHKTTPSNVMNILVSIGLLGKKIY